MARIDRIREEIGWLKLVFGALVAIEVSLVGWLGQNYDNPHRLLVLAAIAGSAVTAFAVVRLTGLMYRRFEELERA